MGKGETAKYGKFVNSYFMYNMDHVSCSPCAEVYLCRPLPVFLLPVLLLPVILRPPTMPYRYRALLLSINAAPCRQCPPPRPYCALLRCVLCCIICSVHAAPHKYTGAPPASPVTSCTGRIGLIGARVRACVFAPPPMPVRGSY